MLILSIMIITTAVIINLLLLIFVIIVERKSKIKVLRKSLSTFSPLPLEKKIFSYKNIRHLETNDLTRVERRFKVLTSNHFIPLEESIDILEKLLASVRIKNIFKFHSLFKHTIKDVKKYEKEYLELRFELFDMVFNVEVEKVILKNLKSKISNAKETIYNSPFKKVKESKVLTKRLGHAFSAVDSLEKSVEVSKSHLGSRFIESAIKIDRYIHNLLIDIMFLSEVIEQLTENLNPLFQNVMEKYNHNKKNLLSIKDNVDILLEEIKKFNSLVKKSIVNFEKGNLETYSNILKKKIIKLHLIVNKNIDFIEFNQKYNNASLEIFNFVNKNHSLIINEIKRHNILDEPQKLRDIDDAIINLKSINSKFEKEKVSNYSNNTPRYLAYLLMYVIEKYMIYRNVTINNVGDITKINNSTNDINDKVSNMNTMLLQIEFDANSLQDTYKKQFEKQKNKLQDKVINLKNNYKNNTKQVNDGVFDVVEELKKDIENLSEEAIGLSLKTFFVKETLLFLNRYRGENLSLDKLLSEIEQTFLDGEISMAIRKSKELIEMYGIKE